MSSKQKIASGILSFIIIWLLILILPDQRAWVKRQITFSHPAIQTSAFPSDDAIAKVLFRHPNDPRVMAFKIEKGFDDAFRWRYINNQVPYINLSKKQPANDDDYFLTIKNCIHQYDALIQRFPHEKWLIQSRLRLTLADLDYKNFDFGTLLSDHPRKNRSINPNTLNAADLKKAIELAQKGETYDPQNSFYNWTLASLCFALRQNEKALNALQQGATKPEYDSGVLQEMQRRAGILKLAGMNSWEDYTNMWQEISLSSGTYLFTKNWTSWAAIRQGAKAEDAGNNQRALDIYGAQLRLVETLFNKRVFNDSIDSYRRLLIQIWAGQNRKEIHPRQAPGKVLTVKEVHQRNLDDFLGPAKRFAAYATKFHRPNLAQKTTELAQEYKSLDPYPDFRSPTSVVGGLPMEKAEMLGRAYWMQSQILYIVLLCAFLTIIAFAGLAIEHKLSGNSESSEIPLPAIDIIAGVIFAFAAVAVYLRLSFNDSDAGKGVFLNRTLVNFLPIDIRNTSGFLNSLDFWVPVFLVFLFVVWCRLSTMWRTRKIVYPERGNFGGILFKWGRTVGSLLVIFLMLLWLFVTQLVLPLNSENTLIIMAAPILIYLAFMVAHKVIVIYLNLPIYRRRIRYFYQWLPRLLGAIALAGSLVYLVIAWYMIPARGDAFWAIREVSKNGEVQQQEMMEQQHKLLK